MSKINLRPALRATSMAVALVSLTVNAWGAERCAKPDEALALQTAAVQQQLMVAALVCRQTGYYNRFVTGYRDELQRSDATLRHYFEHGAGGMAAYHAYKTRLANAASLESLHDNHRYCGDAGVVFRAALANPQDGLTAALGLTGEVPEACDQGTMVAGRTAPR